MGSPWDDNIFPFFTVHSLLDMNACTCTQWILISQQTCRSGPVLNRNWNDGNSIVSVPIRCRRISGVFTGMVLPGIYTLLLYWHILSMIVCVYWYFGRMVAVAVVWLPAAPGVVIVTTSGAAGDGRGVVNGVTVRCHCLWECSQMVPYT